jgi:hypothetical protein
MTEQELRALIRQAIAYHVEPRPAHDALPAPMSFHTRHPSHAMFTLPAEPGDTCVIEPAVQCTHCGFCKTYGH